MSPVRMIGIDIAPGLVVSAFGAFAVDIAVDGWTFLRSEVAYVWILEDELKPQRADG